MNKIDANGEVLFSYNIDGTITVSLRNSGEDSAEITVHRDCEADIKTIVRMIEDRNENIIALEEAISDIGNAHLTCEDSLKGETAEIYNNLNYRKWEKRYGGENGSEEERKKLAERAKMLEAENQCLQKRLRMIERDMEAMKRESTTRRARRRAA